MKKFFTKILRFYNYFIVTALIVYGLTSSKSVVELILFLLLAGIEIYFIYSYFEKFKRKKGERQKKISTFLHRYSLIIAWLLFIILVVSAKQISDLSIVLFIFPLVFELTGIFIKDIRKRKEAIYEDTFAEEGKLVSEDFQMDKRKFLKLFAGTSAGLLALYLFNPKKANAAFFGSIPGPGTVAVKDSLGVIVDPATKNPTDGYGVSDVDEADTTHYYGFIHYNNTDWYVLKETSAGVYTYASKVNNPSGTYTTAWTARASSLIFGTYSEAF